MGGALLRSGKIEAFDALGETGAPVYKSALQIREALKRRAPDLEKHLAIPQISQAGDQIDWYAPISGQLVPWTSATEEERAPARDKIAALKTALESLSADLLARHTSQESNDKVVFAKLLNRVTWFPGEEFVYLVQTDSATNSSSVTASPASTLMPVLTFWGFDTPSGDRSRDPLHCLYPSAAPIALPASAAVAPAAATTSSPHLPPPIAQAHERPWWRRWLWLLLLPFLLALLLFGLKKCAPTLGLPGFPTLGTPQVKLPSLNLPDLAAVKLPGGGPTLNHSSVGLPTIDLPAGPDTASGAGLTGSSAAGLLPAQPKDTAETEQQTPDALDKGTIPDGMHAAPPELAADQQAEPPMTPALHGASGEPLAIPDTAGNGIADFLNGQWRAGAGIQDSRTGKPLRLEYQFDNGQGNATVSRGDGVSCTGPVGASMQNGTLNIVPGTSAACSDGTHYQLPDVNCQRGTGPAADCTGLYGGNNFPLSMRQTAN